MWIRSLASAVTLAAAAPAFAGYYTAPNFTDPAGWTTGEAGSTYQLWEDFASESSTPDAGQWTTNPAATTAPTFEIASPGFIPGPGRTYSFGGDYGATVNITNVTPAVAGLGTHVLFQVGASVNETSVFLDSVQILDADGNLILDGGENGDALQAVQIGARTVSTTMGPGTFEETVVEFFLPGYTGDFSIAWNQTVHTGIDSVRVDTFHSAAALPITAVPEPASLALLLSLGAMATIRRRR